MQRRFVGGLDLDDVACAARDVVVDVFVALDDMQIVVGNVLHVETPAGIAAGAEGVVNHIANGGNAQLAHAIQGAGMEEEQLVSPEEVGSFSRGYAEEIAIEPGDGGTCREPKGGLADQWVSGQIIEGVEGDDLMTEAFKRPESIEGGFFEREAGGVQNLHGVTAFPLRMA